MVVPGVDLVFSLFVSQRVYWFMIFHHGGLSRAHDKQYFDGSVYDFDDIQCLWED